MRVFKTIVVAAGLLATSLLPSLADEANPHGSWQDKYGTMLDMSLCGDGTALCAKLVDVQGKSRTKKNLALLNHQIIQADRTAANEWRGTVNFNGNQAAATVKQVTPNTIEVTGCKAMILCQTLVFNRV